MDHLGDCYGEGVDVFGGILVEVVEDGEEEAEEVEARDDCVEEEAEEVSAVGIPDAVGSPGTCS